MTSVRFEQTSPDHWYIIFAYNPAIIAAIKAAAPANRGFSDGRNFDPTTKRWTVTGAYWAQLIADALVDIGCSVTGLHDYRRAADDSTWAKELFGAATPELRKRLYRALSKELHPDLPHGDATLQRQLNDARNGFEL